MNVEHLRTLAATKPAAALLLNHVAPRLNVVRGSETTVKALQRIIAGAKGPRIARRELVKTLREFAVAGCGRFIAGRHTSPSRMVWALSLNEVKAAINPPAVAIKPPPTETPASQPPKDAPTPNDGWGMFVHPFRLRPTLNISLSLPANLTVGEADRLAKFIQSLPFGESTPIDEIDSATPAPQPHV